MSIDDDLIERLQRSLYSRNAEPIRDIRSPLSKGEKDSSSSWGNEGLRIPDDMKKNNAHPFLKKFLFFAILFFVLCVAVAAYLFFGGGNVISANNVNITVSGPSSVTSGQETDLSVSLINQNPTTLQSVEFSVDYPQGSFADATSSQSLTHTDESIGTISSGQSLDRPEKIYLFGDKGTTKEITFTLQYQVAGSNAVFSKVKKYDVTIGSSPVILDVSAPSQVNSGQSITFTTTITSNATSLLHNVLVSVQYPYGFSYASSSVPVMVNNTQSGEWNMGDLQSGDKKTLTITGTLTAQDGEERTFPFTVGLASSGQAIDTILAQSDQTLTVAKPFIAANMTLNGSGSNPVPVAAGQSVAAVLNLSNTLATPLTNVSISAHVSGAYDPSSVEASNGGFYQSSNNTITWDKNSTPVFANLAPAASANVSFSANLLNLDPSAKNPSVTFSATMTGTRTDASGSSQVTTTVSKTADVIANLSLLSQTLAKGPITNSGPVPPRANTSTTYTIQWTLTNMWNDVSGAKVSTVLPQYVDWTGQVSPTTENISYDQNTRTVTWNPQTVAAGAGYSVSPRQVYFQVRLNSSLSQVGSSPALTGMISVAGHDTFSGADISFTKPAVTTQTADTHDQGAVGN